MNARDEKYDQRLAQQRRLDLAKRQKLGNIFYPLAWLLVSIFIIIDQPNHTHITQTFIPFLILCATSILRYLATRYHAQLSSNKPHFHSLLLLNFNIAISATCFGIISAYSLIHPNLKAYSALIIIANFSLCAGGVIAVCISRISTLLLLFGLLLPPAIAGLFINNSLTNGFEILILFHLISMYWISSLPKNEYEKMIIGNLKLADQAKELAELSIHDGLTGIKNRRYFNQAIATEISRASRSNTPIALLLIDVDHFKKVNDRYGHLLGDECLIKLARVISDCIYRKTDIFARYGGEEFALLLVNIDQGDAINYAERIRQKIEESCLIEPPNNHDITISIGGISLIPDKTTTSESMIEIADKALYESKKQGRNQVTWNAPPLVMPMIAD